MKISLSLVLPLSMLALLAGCQPTKKPAPQNPQIEPIPQSQASMENTPEAPPPLLETPPIEPPIHHAEHARSTPKLGSLNATYNAKVGTLTVVVPGKILFAAGSTKLKSQSHAMLDRIASTIRREYPGHRVYIDGHTDSTPIRSGRWANNHELAADRALAVANYLMKHGIHENDIVIRSYGSINPRSTKEASRRVEIVVVVR